MNTIFISTFNESVIIGLLKDGQKILIKEILSSKNHSLNLIPAVEETLNESDTKINDINEIIVINGPGSFTGVRLGVTVAKTLAYALKATIKTITSIEAISLTDNVSKKIVTVPDNKGTYYGVFENNKLIDEISYLKNDEFTEFIKNYRDYKIINYNQINIEEIYNYLKEKESINPHQVKPVYVKMIEVLNDK